MRETTVHVDDLGDVRVVLLEDESAPCPECGTPGDASGWRLLTVRPFDVFRCPTCSTPCGLDPEPPADFFPWQPETWRREAWAAGLTLGDHLDTEPGDRGASCAATALGLLLGTGALATVLSALADAGAHGVFPA